MIYELNPDCVGFPPCEHAEENGLLAIGGALTPEWLLEAYCCGVFPWFSEDDPILWWSLNPRMVMQPRHFRYAKSLHRLVRSGRFEVRVDTCFEQVIRACSMVQREGQDGTWITEDMVKAYVRLHELGFAHSFETFENSNLVGGLYGVSIADYFCGESMFHTVRDASKVAFARLVSFAQMHGFHFIDAQQPTNHLYSLGARSMERGEFLSMLYKEDQSHTIVGRWRSHTVTLFIGGNQGDREPLLELARRAIGERMGFITRLSAVYETEAWGFEAEQAFLNQALVVDTDLSPLDVLHAALSIEAELGRHRPAGQSGYSSRPMDIDLIFYDDVVMDSAELTLPHPRMQLRRFVLVPLYEIMPDFVHPKMAKTVGDLLNECTDNGAVRKFENVVKC